MIEFLPALLLAVLLVYRERANACERRDLYQRIQAPEMAVARFDSKQTPERKPVPVVGLEDDAALKELRERRERGDS